MGKESSLRRRGLHAMPAFEVDRPVNQTRHDGPLRVASDLSVSAPIEL